MSKHDTVKTITEQNILQKQTKKMNISRDKTSGSQAFKKKEEIKEKKINLTINKTCVCDPHCLYISFNLVHWEERRRKKRRLQNLDTVETTDKSTN